MVNCNPETVSTDYDTSRPPLLRAADARGRARRDRARAARGRDRPVRRPDAAASSRRRSPTPACRCSARRSSRSTWPRTGRASARCSTSSACKSPPYATADVARGGARGRRRRRLPAARAPVATCSAAARWRSVTPATSSPTTSSAPRGGGRPTATIFLDRFLENAIEVDVDALCDGEDGPDRRDHAARRGGRRPLRRLGLRDPGDVARPGDAAPGRGGDDARSRCASA